MNIAETARLFKTILQHYPNFNGSTENARDWQQRLADLPYEIAVRHLDMHIDGSSFPPKVSEIRAGWNDYADRMTRVAQEHIAEQEERRKHAVPPPQEVRDQIAEIKRRLAAKQSRS